MNATGLNFAKRAALTLLAMALAGISSASAGQLRSVDQYKFANLAGGCWNAAGDAQSSADGALDWAQVCLGGGSALLVVAQGSKRATLGSYSFDDNKIVLKIPATGGAAALQLSCDAVVRPYSGLALRHCRSGETDFADVEFAYDNDAASVLLGCWQRVDDDIFPEGVCFDPGNYFETSVYLPSAREGFGSPGKYTYKGGRLSLDTEYPYEGWLWRDESAHFSCKVELADPRHLRLVDCNNGVQASSFYRGDGV